MVLCSRRIQRLDVKRVTPLGPRETYVHILFRGTTPNPLDLLSWLREKHSLVRYFLTVVAGSGTHVVHKLCDHTTHYEITRRWKGNVGVFLLRFSG